MFQFANQQNTCTMKIKHCIVRHYLTSHTCSCRIPVHNDVHFLACYMQPLLGAWCEHGMHTNTSWCYIPCVDLADIHAHGLPHICAFIRHNKPFALAKLPNRFTYKPTSWWVEEDSSCKKDIGMASSALRITSLLAGSRRSDCSSLRQWTLFET